MTIKKLISILEKFSGHDTVVVWPDCGGQHTEEISDVYFVPEVGSYVIRTICAPGDK